MDGNDRTGGLFSKRLATIQPMLQELVDQALMAGAVTLVWRKGELAHFAATGYEDVAAKRPMTRGTLFRLASMTKPVTSLAALMLIEEGKLKLDDLAKQWLPEFANRQVLNDPAGPLANTSPAQRDFTVEDLLTHRSGLAAGFTTVGPIADAYNARQAMLHGMTPDDWLSSVSELPLTCQPGERFQYGLSTDALGLLIARIEGKPLSEVLQQRIFGPLGMHDTFLWVPPETGHRLARMYQVADPPGPLQNLPFPMPEKPPAFESGASSLISTASDYLKFVRLLLGRGEVDGVRLTRQETIALMLQNRLTPAQRKLPFLGVEGWWANRGFGLGLSMILEGGGHGSPSIGSFNWPGAFGTWWLADLVEDMALVFLVQDFFALTPTNVGELISGKRRGARRAQVDFQNTVYAAIAEH